MPINGTFYLLSGTLIILDMVFNGYLGEYGEVGITFTGSLLLIMGYWIKYRAKV